MNRAVTQATRVVCAACLLAAAAPAQTTWHVDDSQAACPGSGTPADPFCTIGAAVAAASPGDTIQVAGGTYFESVVIDKEALTLRGEGADRTMIVGDPASIPIRPGDSVEVQSCTIEGFTVTTSAAPLGITGIWANPQNVAGALWTIRRCVVEDVDLGISANDAWGGAGIAIEDCVVTRCGTGILAIGHGVAIRRSTIFDIEGIGVFSPGYSGFEVSDSIISSTGAWAIQRYWQSPTTIARLLIHDTNQINPPELPNAGPFMQFLAEGFPGGFGVWLAFEPSPGPVVEADPLFAAPVDADVRLLAGSPAIDAGDAGFVADPSSPYDLLGFGHLRVNDGDFNGVERTDLGALEFGGLLTNAGLGGTLSVGQAFALAQSGKPGAVYAAFLGLAGTPLDLGSKGTFFLQPSPLLSLAVGILPAGGTATVVAGTLPPGAAGLALHFQAVQKGPAPGGGLHWTNLEHVEILP